IWGQVLHQLSLKLAKAKLLSRPKFIINPAVLRYSTMAFIGIYLDKTANPTDVVRALKRIPEVLECHYTTGHYSLFIKLLSLNNTHLMHLLHEKIQGISGVQRTESLISLDQVIDRQIHI